MTDILAGATIRSADFPAAQFAQDTTILGDLSNTTFQPGSPVVDTTFTAPTSGRVWVVLGAGARDNAGTNNHAQVSFEIYEGSDATGTLVVSPSHEMSVTPSDSATANYHRVGAAYLIGGLTPEATHYTRMVHRVSGGTSVDITIRDIAVIPTT